MCLSLLRFTSLLVVTVLFAVFSAVTHAQTADGHFVEDFDALANYEFGASRAPLQRISEAVRAAVAGQSGTPYTAQDFEGLLAAMLETDVSLEGKSFICRMLGEIGGTQSVSVLAKQLSNEELFPTALVALEQNTGNRAAVALADALYEASTEKQLAIIAALGRQGNLNSITTLAGALEDTKTEIVSAAAHALADIALPKACLAVMNKMADATEADQLLLADPFLSCANTLYGIDKESTLSLLEQLRQPLFPTHIRLAAIGSLVECDEKQAQKVLLAALQDEDDTLAHQALMLVRDNANAAVIATLTGLLEQATPKRKIALLAVLSDIDAASALPVIMTLTNHADPEVRHAALRAVGILGNAEQINFLLLRATSGPMREQRTAREMLVRLADPDTDSRLLALASRPAEEKLRIRAIATLAERNVEEAAPTLLALAIRSTPEIRKESVRALRTLAPAEMLPQLLRLITPRTLEPIRDLLPQTIARVASRISEPLIQADMIIAALNDAADDETRIVLLETLGLLGTDQAFETIKSYPGTTETHIRRAVVTALARFQSPEALGELRGILLIERDDIVRAKAYSGYISSLRNASQVPLRTVIPHIQTAFEQAKNTAERRIFLAAVTLLPSLPTLHIVEKMAENGDVTAEATQAMAKISIALAGAYPEEARKNLEAIISRDDLPESLMADARKTIALMEQFKGYIMSWAVAGPYYEDNLSADSLFKRELPPELDVENANWKIMPILPDASPAFALELDRVIGGEERAAFLRTKIAAPEAMAAILELGTNDGCRVWWNGTLIHSLNTGRPLSPGEDKLPVQLTAGENNLMIAVFQTGGAWGATVRLVDKNGKPISEITCTPAISE